MVITKNHIARILIEEMNKCGLDFIDIEDLLEEEEVIESIDKFLEGFLNRINSLRVLR